MNVPLITPELVRLDADLGSTKAEVITSVSYTHLTLPTKA